MFRAEVFERFSTTKKSPIHELDPRTKLGFIFIVMLVSIKLQSLGLLITLALSLLLCLRISKILKESSRLLVFLIGTSIFVCVTCFIYSHSLEWSIQTAKFFARTSAMTTAGFLLALTTSPNDLAKSLESLKVPSPITFVFTTAMRFIPTLIKEVKTILDSIKLRGLEVCWKDVLKNPRFIFIPLTIRMISLSDELAMAAESRGFGSSSRRTSLRELKFGKGDYIFLLITVIFSMALLIADNGGIP